ncbi:hypothetical protein [Clostridium saudiense]|uniref:hypothetical protein n=1 Tax=Clostridium saudiense TaxID=1414720 RepID=UPI00399435E4
MYVDLNCIVEPIATLISLTFISCLIAITIYKLIQSWDEGKERYLANEENVRIEELNKKRLENLKLESLEVKLTSEDIELLNLIAGNKGTPKGVLRNMLREHLRN